MKVRAASVVVTIVAAFGLATVAPAAAQDVSDGVPPETSASGYDRCPANHFCAFVDRDGAGPYAAFKIGSPDLRRTINGYVFDNKISSVWHRQGSVTYWLHLDYYHQGLPTSVIAPGYRGNLSRDTEDTASSVSHS